MASLVGPAALCDHIGPYTVVRRIGHGGMAEILQARACGDPPRQLIIKRILPQLADKTDAVVAFINEARLLAMLCHPNVVRIVDFGKSEGRHYIALEYLDGLSLASVMGRARRARKPLPVGFVVFIARELCRGLAAVHALCDATGRPLRIIHRDVTPSNVMTTMAGHVKLLDFGIAKVAGNGSTRLGQIKGKSGYLAPEQVLGATVDGRVDLFAAGVIVHEMLTLEPLFYGEGGDWATVHRILEKPVEPPSLLRRDVPSALDAIVLRALNRSPALRYNTADAMAKDLDAALGVTGFSGEDIVQILADVRNLPLA